MNFRTFKSDKQSLIDEGKRIVSMSDDAKFLRKVTIVNLMLNGASASSLSPSCGETARTLISWMKSVDEEGFDSLRPKKQPGRPAKLTAEQKEKIKVAILSPPEDSGYTVWDGLSLSDYIYTSFGISLGVRQCQRLFHELGFSQIRPQAFPSKGMEDDPGRDAFKKTERAVRRQRRAGRISGRSAFHYRNNHHEAVVPKGKLSKSTLISWEEIRSIQWFCFAGHRGAFCDKAQLVQL